MADTREPENNVKSTSEGLGPEKTILETNNVPGTKNQKNGSRYQQFLLVPGIAGGYNSLSALGPR